MPRLKAKPRLRIGIDLRPPLAGEGPDQCLRVSPALRPIAMSRAQFDCLRTYFPGWRDARRLPGLLHDWVNTSRRELKKGVAAQPLRVLAVETGHGILYFRYFPRGDDGGVVLHIMEQPIGRSGWPGTTSLSPREREVLYWIAQGKREEEIGIILGLARKTVGKHIEHVMRP